MNIGHLWPALPDKASTTTLVATDIRDPKEPERVGESSSGGAFHGNCPDPQSSRSDMTKSMVRPGVWRGLEGSEGLGLPWKRGP